MNINKDIALLGLKTAVEIMKIKKAPHYKVRERYYLERGKAIRRRGASLLSAQKVRLAKGTGIAKSAITRETQADMDLDLMSLIHEDEILRYRAAR